MTEQKPAAKWLILLLLPLLFAAVSFTIGKYSISLSQLLHTIFYHYVDPTQIADPKMETVLFNIRLPRVLAVLMVGGGLSMAGASYQGMFKNPLVSPDILGVSAGAGFGASLALLLSLPMAMVQVFAFCGGMLAVSLAVFVNRSMKYDPLLALILGGILVSTLFSSGISMVKFLADADDKLPAITFWLMGSFSSVNKHDLLPLFIPMGISYVILIGLRWKLNIAAFGDEEARSMGVNTRSVRRWVIIASTLITASSVSICGMIGWIGLVIPHLARAVAGPNYQGLLPVCTAFGACFLLLVDVTARCAWSVELPIGVLTALLGAPFFLLIFKSNTRGWK